MKTDEFLQKLGELLLAPEPVSPGTELSSLAGWDSMGQVSVIGLLDEKLGVQPPPGALAKCETVADILALTNSQLE